MHVNTEPTVATKTYCVQAAKVLSHFAWWQSASQSELYGRGIPKPQRPEGRVYLAKRWTLRSRSSDNDIYGRPKRANWTAENTIHDRRIVPYKIDMKVGEDLLSREGLPFHQRWPGSRSSTVKLSISWMSLDHFGSNYFRPEAKVAPAIC